MGKRKLKALLVPEEGPAHFVKYEGLKDLQKLVGGNIESVPWLFEDSPSVYINDEGKFNGCKPNRAVFLEDGDDLTLVDIIFGPIVCVGFDPETGEDLDITDEEADKVLERFGGEFPHVPAGEGSGMWAAMQLARSRAHG